MAGPDEEPVEPDEELDDVVVDAELVDAELVEGDSAAAADPADIDDLDFEVSIESVISDLEAMVAERDQFLDAYRRAQADFENYRKQARKREEQGIDQAVTRLVTQVLPVLDAGDAARSHGGKEATAAEQIAGLLYDTLAKEGLEAIEAEPGTLFDPNLHDAVAHEPGDSDPVIVDVLRAGYLWKNRVIRPSMVRVKG
jgi:molecular chaperone GrpE